MGITIPSPAAPLASYVGHVVHNGIVIVSGQLPLVDGKLTHTGLLGDGVSVAEGAEAAKICAINILAQVKIACGGDLERIERCIRLGGFVASTLISAIIPKWSTAHRISSARYWATKAHTRALQSGLQPCRSMSVLKSKACLPSTDLTDARPIVR